MKVGESCRMSVFFFGKKPKLGYHCPVMLLSNYLC